MKTVKIKEVLEPEGLYICGEYLKGIEPTFGITDDESTCDIMYNGRKSLLNNCGFVYILTTSEFKKYLFNIEDGPYQISYIPKFKGTVEVGFEDGEIDIPSEDLPTYLQDLNNNEDWINIWITINNTNYYKCPLYCVPSKMILDLR